MDKETMTISEELAMIQADIANREKETLKQIEFDPEQQSEKEQPPKWLIAYRVTNPTDPNGFVGDVYEMLVQVDEASPRDHYLFLYNVYEAEEQPGEDDVVREIQDNQVAKVVGFFSPTTWVFAVRGDTIIENNLFG